MIGPLTKKLFRDLLRIAGPAATIALVVSVGTSVMMAFAGLYLDLIDSRDAYYDAYCYADFEVVMTRAPRAALDEVAGLPGLEVVEGRIARPVGVELPGLARRLSGKLCALPEYGESRVNRLRLLAGRMPEPGGIPEVVVIEDLARARGLAPGSRFSLVADQTRRDVVVCGVAQSPEFVFVLPENGGWVPDPKNSGVFWARQRFAEDLFNHEGAITSVIGRVGPGTNPKAMAQQMERILTRFGVLLAVDRNDMLPYALLKNEIRLTLIRATTIPMIFLIAAALVLNLVLTRLVTTQRVQVGTMKAIGMGNLEVLVHYVGFAVVISGVGTALGAGLGFWLEGWLTFLYKRFYHIPGLEARFHPQLALVCLAAALGSALLATLRTCLGLLELTPAEAMRPSPPETRAGELLPRFGRLSILWRIALRNMLRHPFRTGVSSIGIALGVALMVTSRFFQEGISHMNVFHFQVIERQDYEVGVQDGTSRAALDELVRLPGVLAAEAAYVHPFEVSAGRYRRRVLVQGIEPGAVLKAPKRPDGSPVPIPERGLLVCEKLLEVLGVGVGDEVDLESLRGDKRVRRARIVGTYPTYMSLDAYASRSWLGTFVDEPEAVTGLALAAPGAGTELEAALARRGGVVRVTPRRDKIRSFVETMQGAMEVASWILIVFGGLLACGMSLNGALVGLAERRTELAVLRVQGFSRSEIGDMLMNEQVLTGLAGMGLGIPFGYLLTWWIQVQASTEILRLPFIYSAANVASGLYWSALFQLFSHGVTRLILAGMDWRGDLAVKE